jgi:hypothetical protein
VTVSDSFSRGHGGKKARRLNDFITGLLAHRTIEDAATFAKISLSSAYRWLRDPSVVQQLAKARHEGMKATMAQLQANAASAVNVLDRLQTSAESEGIRLGAARAILAFAIQSSEILDLAERLDAIEQKVNSPNWRNNNAGEGQTSARAARGSNGHA